MINNIAYTFSPKLTISGHCIIDRFRLEAIPTSDDRDTRCPEDETCTEITSCGDNPFSYETTT